MTLLLKNISVPLAPFTLEVDVEIGGRVTAIFGPSGAGKTSLLDLVAGLRGADSAFIQIGERVLTDTARGVWVPSRQRGIGYVPQDLALFPHLSVRQNLLYGHKPGNHGPASFTFERVAEVLEIQSLAARRVTELSGGEQQRVAVARALLSSPQLLLLDEPLASLDLPLRARIIPYLARIRAEFRVPMLYVTHDRYEALALADEMVVLVAGKVAQAGPVQELFGRPANLAAAGALAVETVLKGTIESVANGLVMVAVGPVVLAAVGEMVSRGRPLTPALSPDGGEGGPAVARPGEGETGFMASMRAQNSRSKLPAGTRDVYVCIRAENVVLMKGSDSASSARNHLAGVVRAVGQDGPLARVELDCGFPLTALLTKQSGEEMKLGPGDRVTAQVKAQHVHLIGR